jgi:trimethylamine--corrinoid protein Co-methyltransferase
MPVRFSHVRFRAAPHQVHQDFTVSAGGFCCFLHDLAGRRRPAARKDVLCAINMVNHLANIDYTGLPVSDQSVPADHRPIVMAATLAKYTHKLGGIETFRKEDVAPMCDIGRIVAGSAEALAAWPVLVGYAEVRSPLCFDRNMVDIFLEYVKRGVPQTVDTMPAGGTTAPVTAAGILALGLAETLAGVVLAYAVRDDAVVGMDVTCSYSDMSSGLYRYAGAERCSLLMARVQMLSEYYGCPAGVHGGKTDSCFYNEQAGAEKMSTMLTAAMAGAVGFGTVGHLENAVTFSPVQLVIDNEMAGYVRRVVRQPIAVDADSLAVDLIDAVGPGGEFLSQAHTAERFRDELFLSPLFAGLPWGQARRDPAQADTFERARSMARELWRPPAEPVMSDDQVRELRRVVRQATGKTYSI